MGPPSRRSSAFPCGMPSMTSKRTTSPRPFSAQRCASVPPIMPAPMSAIFLRAMRASKRKLPAHATTALQSRVHACYYMRPTDHAPELRLRRTMTVGLFAATFAYLLTGIRLPLGLFDEGFELYGAVRVLAGEVPYRDFWYVYPPGELYVLAGLFAVVGPSA